MITCPDPVLRPRGPLARATWPEFFFPGWGTNFVIVSQTLQPRDECPLNFLFRFFLPFAHKNVFFHSSAA